MDPIPPGAQAALDRLNAPSQTASSNNALARLDSGDFLRLLTTQLTIQDPLEPVNNEQMLAQMAQFSSLAATTESGATLGDISAKLDRLIEAQEAARAASEAAAAAAEAARAAADAAGPSGAAVNAAAPTFV
ncbi:MAG: flagellar hook capping FlgD N-terminal domain-containing protein [Erythrobacter sp.]|uniref:flagellar hook assembly protein FlgD n=1 Tax=Erythrobacter sp. TaxID=1042 RepID=UPI0032EAB31D